MVDRNTALGGGFKPLLSEALPSVSSSTGIFANAPANTCFATITVRGGVLTINFGSTNAQGNPVPQDATPTSGTDYSAGTYEFVNVASVLVSYRAISATVTSGWITYFGVR